nr:DUF1273 family protein [bacterium]
MLKVYTSQIGSSGDLPALDITVKSGDKVFAPTWDMVMSFKRGQLSWQEYEDSYYAMMRRSWVENKLRWQEVLAMGEVVLTCYCRGDEQCHRRLLKEMLVMCGAEDGGEILPSQPSIKIAFSGHRNLWDKTTVETAKWWCEAIADKYPSAVIRTGGAVGVDKIVATQALRLGLRSEIYLPFPFEVFTARWKVKTQNQLASLLAQSDVTVVGGEKFRYDGYLSRNAKMVSDADAVVAFYDGRL